ncbi:MAG TPA: response regulator [bacterium]|jgi:two-component system cell cycle sensor histidine kinase/response regulator CckA|nr:response regulator [bacterium]
MTEALSLLLVEDSDDDATLLLRNLRDGGFETDYRQVQTEGAMRAALDEREWDLVISDYSMPTFDGISAYLTLRDSGKDIPFIFVSGTLGEDKAVEAMRSGVSDYIVKGSLKRLVPAIRRELGKSEDRRRYRRAEAALREAEQKLRISQRLEVMGRLAGGVAHDFNNLLTVILGHTDLMLRDLEETNEHWQGLNEIQDCSERAAALTRQLLQFGGNESARRRRVDINLIVSNASILLKRMVGSGIELDLRIPEEPCWILADPDQLGRILTNLAVNARDAMNGMGKLRVSLAARNLTEQDLAASPQMRPGPHVLLEIEDNGQGMSAEVMSHLFEPFYTTKANGKGTGLGLAIVFAAVQQNEGSIGVRSEAGQGTVFSMFFPQVLAEESEGPQNYERAKSKEAPRGVETVLVAEDSESLRDYIRLALSRRGFHVLAAADGEQALELGRLHPGTIHLLLADLGLAGGMDGRELARRLVAQKRPTTRVLFTTSRGDALDEGGSGLLIKPFNVEELVKAVREAMSNPRPFGFAEKTRETGLL